MLVLKSKQRYVGTKLNFSHCASWLFIILHLFFFGGKQESHSKFIWGQQTPVGFICLFFFRLLLPALLANFCCTEMLLTFMADNIQCKSAKVENVWIMRHVKMSIVLCQFPGLTSTTEDTHVNHFYK